MTPLILAIFVVLATTIAELTESSGGPVTLRQCNTRSPVMAWDISVSAGTKSSEVGLRGINGCLSLYLGPSWRPPIPIAEGVSVRSQPCGNINATLWKIKMDEIIGSDSGNSSISFVLSSHPKLCLGLRAPRPNTFAIGYQAQLRNCTNINETRFKLQNMLSPSTIPSFIVHSASLLCLEGSIPPVNNTFHGGRPCDPTVPNLLRLRPWCDTTKSIDVRVAALLKELHPEEKSCWFGGPDFLTGYGYTVTCGIPRLNISAFQWWHEALHGVKVSQVSTSFPQPIGMAGSFNRTLLKLVGEIIGSEARAFTSPFVGGTWWAPNINTVHDPRWGRGQETPGEDPYLTSEYAYLFVTGFQGGKKGIPYLKASSCCKHFAVYNEEAGRQNFNAIVNDPRDFDDTYFPAFKSCAQRAGASGVMCAYNAVNGQASCGNKWLIETKLRGEWNFDGYVTGDCRAVGDGSYRNISSGVEDTIRVTWEAGTDIDCGNFMDQSNIDRALLLGNVTETLMDVRLSKLLRTQFRLGFFNEDDTLPAWIKFNVSNTVDIPQHRQAAKEAAEQSLVLLKLQNASLPLDPSKLRNLAVVGPLATATKELQGNYAGRAPYLISPLAGFTMWSKDNGFNISYEQGCSPTSNQSDPVNISKAERVAAKADATILVVGAGQQEGGTEGHDRTNIGLPLPQGELISAVASAANGKPVIVVVISGESLDLNAIHQNRHIHAILWSGYPGQSGGEAIANAIFGKVNPSGRLPISFFKTGFTKEIDIYDMGMRPNITSGNPGRTYRFYSGKNMLYPFGYGLSYTTFNYSGAANWTTIPKIRIQAALGIDDLTSAGTASVLITRTTVVKNTGTQAGATSILCFVTPPGAGKNGIPIKKLVDFDRVFLQPGQSESVNCNITALHLSEPEYSPMIGEHVRIKHQTRVGEWIITFGVETILLVI